MQEILRRLERSDRVLDLGAGARGSFPAPATQAAVVRLDVERPRELPNGFYVIAEAERLPFRSHSFRAVIANHTLEHFPGLDRALAEVGRVLRADGWFFASVPDAATLSDRLYRWLGRGGGHLNPFVSRQALEQRIERATGLPAAGGRTLYASWSFLNRRNIPGKIQRKLYLLGGGSETVVRWWSWAARRAERLFGARCSIYGWALYFGRGLGVERSVWSNVCIRCGAGRPTTQLRPCRQVFGLRSYACPACGARNFFSEDAGLEEG